MTRQFILLIAFMLASLGVSACTTASASKAGSLITSPASNSEFHEGDQVTITSTSVDPAGIARVEMLVDGKLVRTDQPPVMQQSIVVAQPWTAALGTHTISVRAVNASGVANEPAAIVLKVLPGQAQISATPIARTGAPATATPSQVSNGNCTPNATLVTDVTVPDGTTLAPNQTVTKIWRVRNIGTCTWGQEDQLVFTRGEQMTPAKAILVPTTAPGETADLLIPITAPTTPGNHQGEWRFKNKNGTVFGTPLTIVINIAGAASSASSGSNPCPFTPVIESFTATNLMINPGETTTLKWGAVVGAQRADIDNGIGGVATPGSIDVSPTTTTIYTLTATCASKTRTAQVTITVR